MRGCGRSPARTGCSCTARPRPTLGLADDDWVWIESVNGRVKGQIRLVDGVNPETVWTWNAIGKRRGSWGLKDDAGESNRGFLLNHTIGDRLAGGKRLLQLRSGDRPGGVVRPARPHREMRAR